MKRLAALIAALALITGTASAEFYSTLFRVDWIESNTATLIDCNGFTWLYDEPEDMEVDDFYTAVMDDNGTDEIFDDIIVSLRYERPDLF